MMSTFSSKRMLAVLVIFGCATSVSSAQVNFVATIDSSQEVAPGGATNSTGTGSAELTFNDLGGSYSLDIAMTFDSLFNFMNVGGSDNGGATTITALHIHNEQRGANGSVVFGMISPSSDLDGDFMLTNNGDSTTTITTQWDSGEGNGGADLDDFIGALTSAAPGADVPLYINLHSSDDGAGVIRGQIVRVPEPTSIALVAAALCLAFARKHG